MLETTCKIGFMTISRYLNRQLVIRGRWALHLLLLLLCVGCKVHALDLGTGCGVLALLAARCGADSVTAVEAHPTLVAIARHNAALNGLSRQVGNQGCRGQHGRVPDFVHQLNHWACQGFPTSAALPS